MNRKDWLDISFTALATVKEYSVEYRLYKITGSTAEPCDVNDLSYGDDFAPLLIDGEITAQVYAHGYVKWDGCSNWHIDEQDGIMLHFCTQDEIGHFTEAMKRCWAWTKELIPENWFD